MNDFNDLLKSLESLEARDRPVAETLRELDAFAREQGDALPPRLAHFLERRSYSKALDFLRGQAESIPPGGCSAHAAS